MISTDYRLLYQKSVSWLRFVSIYRLVIALLLLAALAGIYGIQASAQLPAIVTLAVAVLSTVVAQALVDWKTSGTPSLSQPAIISGLIIGSILSPETNAGIVVIVCFIAMLCKRFIRVQNNPLFNPAALGLIIVGIAFGTHDAWWAATPTQIPVLLLVLSMLVLSWKLDKLPLQAAFLITWLLAWGTAVLAAGNPLQLSFFVDITPFYLMAFMLLEHATSPKKRVWQYVYGCFVALAGFAFTRFGFPFDAMLLALLAGNALTKALPLLRAQIENNRSEPT